jgi:hypothetical protein
MSRALHRRQRPAVSLAIGVAASIGIALAPGSIAGAQSTSTTGSHSSTTAPHSSSTKGHPTTTTTAPVPFPTVKPYPMPPHPGSGQSTSFTPPQVCYSQPTGVTCEELAVNALDVARRRVGLKPYHLPSDFLTLTPEEQLLVLANSDRAAYKEQTFYGLDSDLSNYATQDLAVAPYSDPGVAGTNPIVDTVPLYYQAEDSAQGYPNVLLAYGSWLYDDGPGSPNVDCTAKNPSGCWTHRDNILRNFRACYQGTLKGGRCVGGTWAYLRDLTFGAATGKNSSGRIATTVIVVGTPIHLPQATYTYTWQQAQAAGAK